MKRLCLIGFALIVLAACGHKTQVQESTADSTVMDPAMVEAQVRACFDTVNKMGEKGAVNITQLDSMFCSKDFLELQGKLYKKVRESKGATMFDGDEGHHWLPGIGTPLTIDTVMTELVSDELAQAEVWLKDEHGNQGHLNLTLYLEDDVWKIHNWTDKDVYPSGSLFEWMWHIFNGE